MTITKEKNHFFIHWPKKINIRWAILAIILPLLIGLSTLIIYIDYKALDSILITSAHSSLSGSCGKVSEQINNYFKPLNNNITLAFHILKNGIVKPGYSSNFTKFLYSFIVSDKHIHGAFWGDANGNLYWLRKASDGRFYEQTVLRNRSGNKHIENIFDSNLRHLSTKEFPFDDIDPRLRPWYKQAQAKKQLTWITYKFLKETGEGKPLGITAAFPFYDAHGKLLGVFGLDVLIENISTYIHEIKVTPNSIVFVTDNINNLISVHNTDEHLLEDYEFLKIDDLKKPWLQKSFSIFQTTHKPSFTFSINNKKYIAAYSEIADTKVGTPWIVAIVTPIDDITAPLRRNVFIFLIMVCVAFIIAIFLVSIFSSKLSRPIKRLAQNAHLICHLRFDEVNALPSHITEISEVDKSFMKMKNALSSFQLYLPAALVKKIVTSNKLAVIGGETKELTLMFTDIQNFTHLAENTHPNELMLFLTKYFHTINKVITEMSGTVDKYMGDGVMAFWGTLANDLEHPQHACQAALKIQKTLKQLNAERQLENKPPITTRIGINTGNVLLGNIGSDDRFNYTTLGDSVNLASRLEGLSKIYGTTIIISEFTYNRVKNNFKLRLLDKVAVKGKKIGGYIYELLEELSEEPDLALEQYNQKFFEAFTSYEKGDWQKALELFNNLNNNYPDDLVIKLFIKRCSIFNLEHPENWDGIWVMSEKS